MQSIDPWHLYSLMYKSRIFENTVNLLWYDGKIFGEMHPSLGEEGIAAGIIDHLKEGDSLALDHRGTAYCIIRGVDRKALMLEMLGHKNGLCGGMGGHMHLFSKEFLITSNGIVGAAVPAAVGFALAAQLQKKNTVAVAFFGEGAMNQGMLLESFNLAAVWRLPVLFVCKDNNWAITTVSKKVTSGTLLKRAEGFGLKTTSLNGSNVIEVWEKARYVLNSIRNTSFPQFLHISCFHPEGHFLEDPLISSIRNIRGKLIPMSAQLLKAGAKGFGNRIIQSSKGLMQIISLIGKTMKEQVIHPEDPVFVLRKKLYKEDKNRLDQCESLLLEDLNKIVLYVLQTIESEEYR